MNRPAPQSGTSLIEVLVALLVLTVGLMGLAGLHTRTLKARLEADDRLEALMRLEDALSRLRADPNCRDETCLQDAADPVGAARFPVCLTAGEGGRWRVSVAWLGVFDAEVPADTCGTGLPGPASKRRVVSTALFHAAD